MFKTTIFIPLLAVSLFFQACSNETKKEESTTQKANAILSTNEFPLRSIDNTQLTLQKTSQGFYLKNDKNKLLLIDVFATWCPPCQASASHLSSLQKKYEKDIKVIGVSVEDNIDNAKLQEFATQHNATYTLVNSDQNRRLIDTLAQQLKLGNNFGIPLLAIYKDGKLIRFYQGATEEEFIESDIKRALGK